MATYIFNKYKAAEFLLDPRQYNVIIRITSPMEDLPALKNKSQYKEILELKFYDFTEETNGLQLFSDHHLDTIIKFFTRHIHCDNLVVHCEQGISRSAGVVVGWFLFKEDRGSIYRIYHGRKYLPNKRIVEMFAKKLQKNIAYIDKWDKEKFTKQ